MVPVEGNWALPCVNPTFVGRGKTAALLRPTGHPSLVVPEKIAAEDLPQQACSIEAWVAIDSYSGRSGFFSALEHHGGAQTGFMLGTLRDHFVFGLSTEGADDGDGQMTYLSAPTPFEHGRWYYVVATYDGTTQRIFVDGELQGVSTAQSGNIKYLSQHIVAVGGYVDSNENYPLTGALHEVSLHDVCLSDKAIQRQYRKLRGKLPEPEGRTFNVAPLQVRPPLSEMQKGINLAIDGGVQSLLRNQLFDGSWEEHATGYRNGATSLALYTLIKCGLKADHPAIVRALQFLRAAPPAKVYSAGCQLLALGALGDPAHQEWAEEIVALLLSWESKTSPGSWGYPGGAPDLSNTQYAALGFWSASRLGVKIPRKVLGRMVERVLHYQPPPAEVAWPKTDGGRRSGKRRIAGFTYREGGQRKDETGTMTTAGLCVLTIPSMIEGRISTATGRMISRGRTLALGWLEHHYPMEGHPKTGRLYYYLYGLERVGAFLDLKEIGGHQWYRDGAMTIVKNQKKGAWGGTSSSCFALLFLRRASAPTQTGKAVTHSIQAYSDDKADVFLHATGNARMTFWLHGFTPKRLDLYKGLNRSWEGLRVERVIYLADGKEVVRVEGDRMSPWVDERFPARYTFEVPGAHTLQARVLLVPPDADLEVGTRTEVVESGILNIVTIDSPKDWMAGILEAQGKDLLEEVGVTASASSTRDPVNYGPELVLDNLARTRWSATPDDQHPWFRLDMTPQVQANTLVLYQGSVRLTGRAEYTAVSKIAIRINGKPLKEVDLSPDILQPLIVDFGEILKVNWIELRVLDRAPDTRPVGFSTIELQKR